MPSRARQRGAASLVVAMIILFGMTMVAFYANRGLLFEQRTSANQYRATSAFEVAEAGLEWATARLNEPLNLNAVGSPCVSSSDKTFRDTYLRHTTTAVGFNPVATAYPGCRIPASGAPVCSCPTAGNPSLGTGNEPNFRVEFRVVGADPESVEVRSYGCLRQDAACAAGLAEGIASVRVIVKLLPALRVGPKAALTAGGDVNLGVSAVNIINTDASTNGITVNAGLSAPGAGSKVTSLPGLPPEASVVPNDSSLSSLNTADPSGNAIFRSYLGQNMADYKASPGTTVVCTGLGSSACGSAVVNAIASGKTQLWIDAQAEFTDGNVPVSLGTAANPVLLVSPFGLTFNMSRPVFGVLVGAQQTWNVSGAGTPDVRGAVITRDDFNNTGNLTLTYDAAVLQKLRPATGSMVRVPGSWRDFSL